MDDEITAAQIGAVRRNLTQIELTLMDRDEMGPEELRARYTETFMSLIALGERIAP